MFSVVWSIGAAIEEKSRKGFSDLISKLITEASDIPQEFNIENELLFPFKPNSVKAKL